ncbi:MAG: hypothetical protein EB015_02300, partial [Methylocystaceae bacterium]|nr:hypothetical protein [Methylocystaceae bacterium]
MTRKGKRMTLIVCALAIIGVAVALILFALRDNIVFFYTPSELAKKQGLTRRKFFKSASG